MKWLTNNFSLNMVNEDGPFDLKVRYLSELAFKVESKTAKVRLSQMDVCQELDIFPNSGNVNAHIGDEILVAQYKKGKLTYRKVIVVVGDIQ